MHRRLFEGRHLVIFKDYFKMTQYAYGIQRIEKSKYFFKYFNSVDFFSAFIINECWNTMETVETSFLFFKVDGIAIPSI